MTLIELLVVLAIIGLVVGISMPSLVAYNSQARLKTSIRQVMGLVSFARQQAITSHEEQAVVIDPDGGEITVVAVSSGDVHERRVRLSSAVTIEVQVGGEPAPDPQLVFRPTGSLNGRTTSLILANRDRQRTITVTAATGAIFVQ